jgi:hypothetical protein
MEYPRKIKNLLAQERELSRLGIKIPKYFDSEFEKAHKVFMRTRRTAIDYFFLAAETVGLLTLVAMSVHGLTNGTETDQICAHPF